MKDFHAPLLTRAAQLQELLTSRSAQAICQRNVDCNQSLKQIAVGHQTQNEVLV